MLHFTLRIASRLEARERELRQANDALRTSQVAIQDLQRRRSRFMQTAAHQLKAPLAVIQTLTELIRSNVVPPDAVAKTCDKIVRRCADGIAQVSELITLAPGAGGGPRPPWPLGNRRSRGCQRVVRAVCSLSLMRSRSSSAATSARAGEANVSVERRDLTGLHRKSDRERDQVHARARKRDRHGRRPPLVAASSKLVMVCVADTGMGMPPEMLQAQDNVPGQAPIFDAFRRGNNAIAAGIPGTGLGLSIVREVVEQAGGRPARNLASERGFQLHHQSSGSWWSRGNGAGSRHARERNRCRAARVPGPTHRSSVATRVDHRARTPSRLGGRPLLAGPQPDWHPSGPI